MEALLDDDGCRRLGVAVIKAAVKDYAKALREYMKNPNNMKAKGKVMECEAFFCKNFDLYAFDSNLDGKEIMHMIRKMISKEQKVIA